MTEKEFSGMLNNFDLNIIIFNSFPYVIENMFFLKLWYTQYIAPYVAIYNSIDLKGSKRGVVKIIKSLIHEKKT